MKHGTKVACALTTIMGWLYSIGTAQKLPEVAVPLFVVMSIPLVVALMAEKKENNAES